MAIRSGQMLLHYRVVEKIGSGGMGEVWCVEDTKLRRKVALKTLPPWTVADARLRSLFEREAQVVAGLNHPNIVTAYSIEEADGVPFLTMELIEGRSLGRVFKEAPSLERFFALAIPLADAVGAAHEQGVLHRDLKPDNVMVTESGSIKVLDFGLAKLRGELARPEEGETPTQEQKLVGSAAYMSPEQAETKAVGPPSDVFSLGILLYHLACGKPPFSGKTSIAIISSIIKDEPPLVTEVDPTLPRHLGRIIRRCLDKEPDRRYATAQELRLELELLKEELAVAPGNVAPPRAAGGWRRAVVPAVVGTLAIVAALGWLRSPGEAPAAPEYVVSQQTFRAGVETSPAIAPGGGFMAYEAASADGDVDVFLQRMDSHNPINLTADSEAYDGAPAISPDATRIAFRSSRDVGGIYVMGATGEDVRRITDFGFDPAWSPDGTRLVFSTEAVDSPLRRSRCAELWIADVKTGETRKIYDGDAVQPAWSPGGQRIAFWTAYINDPSSGERDLGTVRSDGSDAVVIEYPYSLDWRPVWSADGRELLFASDRGGSMNLWSVAIDERSGATRGQPQPRTTPSAWTGPFSVSADGMRIAYVARDDRAGLISVPFDPVAERPLATPVPVTSGGLFVYTWQASPDGDWIAFSSMGRQEDIYLVRSDGSGLRKVTDDLDKDRGVSWLDREHLVFYSNRGGGYEIWTIRTDGSELKQLTETTGRSQWMPQVSPDGTRLLTDNAEGSYVYELTAGGPVHKDDALHIAERVGEDGIFRGTEWSQDGTRILGTAYAGLTTTTVAVYDLESHELTPYEAPGKVDALAGNWFPDGQRFLATAGGWAWIVDTRTGVWKRLDLPVASGAAKLTADGRSVQYIQTTSEADIWLAEKK